MSNTAQLSASDRIAALLDSKSFVEIGAMVTKRNTDFNLLSKDVPSDGVITGYGLINDKLVYVYSQDVSALNGTIGEMHAKKITRIYDLAMKVGAPVIGLIDCAGLRLEEATDALAGFGEVFFKQSLASGVIPQITAVLGSCGGGSAISASLSDFVFMEEKKSKLFVNAPNTIMGNNTAKCDTAAAAFMAEAGSADFVGEELSLFSGIRNLISVLPSNNEDDPATEDLEDNLNRDLTGFSQITDITLSLKDLSDNGFFLEIKEAYAKEMVTGFIRLNGMTVGVIANRKEIVGDDGKAVKKFDASLTSAGCYKAERFAKICNSFNVPILTLTNVNGFSTSMADAKTLGAAAAKLTYAFANATVPKVNLITEQAYGSAYIVMNSKHIGADMVFALDNAQIGTMEADMAAQIMYPDADKAVRSEKASEYNALQQNVLSAARRGYVDAVISGESVRRQLIYSFEMLYTKRDTHPAKKHGTV